MPPAGGHKVRRRAHQGSPPPRYGDKGYSSCFASVKETPIREALDRLFEGVARAEGGNLLGRDLHLLAGLGIPALPSLTLPHGELPEACDLDLLASLERFGHYLFEGLEVLLDLALGHPSFLGDPLDEFHLFHGHSFLWSSSAPWRACLVCLLPVYTPCLYESRNPLPPPHSRLIWRNGNCGGVQGEVHHIWHKHLAKVPGRIIHAPKHCCSRCSMLIGPILSAAPKRGVNSGKQQCRSASGRRLW